MSKEENSSTGLGGLRPMASNLNKRLPESPKGFRFPPHPINDPISKKVEGRWTFRRLSPGTSLDTGFFCPDEKRPDMVVFWECRTSTGESAVGYDTRISRPMPIGTPPEAARAGSLCFQPGVRESGTQHYDGGGADGMVRFYWNIETFSDGSSHHQSGEIIEAAFEKKPSANKFKSTGTGCAIFLVALAGSVALGLLVSARGAIP